MTRRHKPMVDGRPVGLNTVGLINSSQMRWLLVTMWSVQCFSGFGFGSLTDSGLRQHSTWSNGPCLSMYLDICRVVDG